MVSTAIPYPGGGWGAAAQTVRNGFAAAGAAAASDGPVPAGDLVGVGILSTAVTDAVVNKAFPAVGDSLRQGSGIQWAADKAGDFLFNKPAPAPLTAAEQRAIRNRVNAGKQTPARQNPLPLTTQTSRPQTTSLPISGNAAPIGQDRSLEQRMAADSFQFEQSQKAFDTYFQALQHPIQLNGKTDRPQQVSVQRGPVSTQKGESFGAAAKRTLNKLQTDAKNENTRLASQGKGWRQVAFERSNQTPSIFSGTSSELKTLLQKGHIKEADLKASGVPMSFVNGGVVTPPKGLSPEEREKLTGTKNGVRQDLPLGEKPAPANHTGRKAESGVKTGTAAFPGKASEAPKGVNTAHKPDRVNNLSPQIMTSQTDVPGSIGEAINETDKELKGPYLNPGEGTGVCEIYSNKIAKKLAEKGVQAEVVKLDDIGRSHAVVVAKTSEGEYLIDRTIGQFVRPDNVITRTGAMYGSAKKRVEDNKTVQDLVNKGVSKLEPGDLQRYKDFMKVEPPPSKSK